MAKHKLKCTHPEGFRKEGPMAPIIKGFAKTEVCTQCNMYRCIAVRNNPGNWKKPLLQKATNVAE